MSGWGGLNGFAGGLASGLNNGLALGQRINSLIQEDQLNKVREQGLAEARAAQAAAAPKIVDNGDEQNLTSRPQQSADPNMAPQTVNTDLSQAAQTPQAQQQGNGMQTYAVKQPDIQGDLSSRPMASADPNVDVGFANGLPQAPVKRFNVGGQGFDTQEEAAAYVKKQTPALASFYKDTLIPRMTEALIQQGKPDQAAAWQKYADEDQTRTNMGTWGKAVQLAQFGDYNGAAQELFKLHPHFDDGLELVSAKETTGPNGEQGFTMTVKNEDGKTEQIFHDAKTITEFGLSQLSPIEMFNKRYQRQTQVDAAAAKEAIDERNDIRTENRVLKAQDSRNKAASERQQEAEKARKDRQESDNKAKDARLERTYQLRAQQDAERIKAAGVYRKGTSPAETRKQVFLALAKDPIFSTASKDEQNDRIDRAIEQINAGTEPQGQTVSNPMQQGLPQQAPAGKVGVPVFDPATGAIKNVWR